MGPLTQLKRMCAKERALATVIMLVSIHRHPYYGILWTVRDTWLWGTEGCFGYGDHYRDCFICLWLIYMCYRVIMGYRGLFVVQGLWVIVDTGLLWVTEGRSEYKFKFKVF